MKNLFILLPAVLVVSILSFRSSHAACDEECAPVLADTGAIGGANICEGANGQVDESKCAARCLDDKNLNNYVAKNNLTLGVVSAKCENNLGVGGGKPECYCRYSCSCGTGGGDPHYVSFDGIPFDYQGTAKHYLVKPCQPYEFLPNFEVRATNRPWGNGAVSIIDSLELVVPEWERIVNVKAPDAPGGPFVLTVNGAQRSFPYQFPPPGTFERTDRFIIVSNENGLVTVKTSFGLRMTLVYGAFTLNLPKHPEIAAKACGLLGRPNGNKADDFIDANRIQQPPVVTDWAAGTGIGPFNWDFGNSWIVSENDRYAAECLKADMEKKFQEHKEKIKNKEEDKARITQLCKATLQSAEALECANKLNRPPPNIDECVFDALFLDTEAKQKEWIRGIAAGLAAHCGKHVPFFDVPCNKNLVVLYRLYRAVSAIRPADTSYTPSLAGALRETAYKITGSPGLVATSASDCLNDPAGFKAIWDGKNTDDTFFSDSDAEIQQKGYSVGDRRFFCAKNPGECGATLPLYRFLTGTDYYLTTNVADGANSTNGEKKILCYIWPNAGAA